MTGSFNAIVRRFEDFLATDRYDGKRRELAAYEEKLKQHGIAVRHDYARVWEPLHVLLRLDDLLADGRFHGPILDFGGGNSSVGYALAAQGLPVNVLDVDATVHSDVKRGATSAGLGDLLSSTLYNGHQQWPFADGQFGCIIAVSVFEGLTTWGRRLFWEEVRRVLSPGGRVLLTFDYGLGARAVSDPLTSAADLRDLIVASGLELDGELPTPPTDDDLRRNGPVKLPVSTLDGHDWEIAQYSFGAMELVKSAATTTESTIPIPEYLPISDLGRTMTDELPRALVGTIEDREGEVLITSPQGEPAWQITLTNLHPTVRLIEGDHPPYAGLDSVALIEPDDLRALLAGQADLWDLHYRGRFELRGDVSLVMRIIGAWQDFHSRS